MFPALLLSAALATNPANETHNVFIEARVVQGDPLGVGVDSQKVLSEPKLVTLSGRAAFFRTGGKKFFTRAKGPVIDASDLIPLGTEVEFLPITRGDGKIYVEFNIKHAVVIKGKDGLEDVNEGQSRTSVVLDAGGSFKHRISSVSATEQTWVEFTVRHSEEKPAK